MLTIKNFVNKNTNNLLKNLNLRKLKLAIKLKVYNKEIKS
jgi:hypothetical protein